GPVVHHVPSSLRCSPGSAETHLRRRPLHDRHGAAGARMIGFAGWEVPGQDGRRGPGEPVRWQRLLSADGRRLPGGGAQYAVLCREDGGVLDDLITYRLAEREYLTVTNAANHAADLEWFTAHASGFDVDVFDLSDQFAM